ncbi:YibE/F family protein [Bavariicoccus seileri]|uniref:YibE/F family protein n=1 Tax=Bavariicoccus seileri TaxID=549685 RepID=UPI003F917E59
MNTLVVLLILLSILIFIVFGEVAFSIISGTVANFCLFILLVLLLVNGLPVYGSTLLIFLAIAAITLFYINEFNRKTLVAFICVLFFLMVFTLVVWPLIHVLKVYGFPPEELDELSEFDFSVNVPFAALNTSLILLSFSGAVIDGSMAISSASSELVVHAKQVVFKEVLSSSLVVVRDVLNSTINTLLFAFMGSNLGLIIWLQDLNYSFQDIINSKVFVGGLLTSVLSGIAAVLILPLTSAVASYTFCKSQSK